MTDKYFLELAAKAAEPSKDPSTKTGAVIVDKHGVIVSMGRNGFPRQMPDRSEWLNDREQKYSRIVHCEMNALIFAKRDLQDCTLYTWPFLSCDRCAVHMIQAGITRFVAPKRTDAAAERWEPVFIKTREYCTQCGVECVEYVQ